MVGASIVLVLAVWSKQYILAVLTSITFFVAARPDPKKIVATTLSIYLLFSLFYSPWIIRNYVSYGELAPFTGKTNGLRVNSSDWMAVFRFLAIFYENNTPVIYSFLEDGKLVLPPSKFADDHREEIESAARLAYDNGTSFLIRKPNSTIEADEAAFYVNTDFDQQIITDAFMRLTYKAKNEMGFFQYYRTSFASLKKSIFKNSFSDGWGVSSIQELLFGYRGILVILGFSAISIARKRVRWFVCGVLIYWFSTVFVLSFIVRHLEMRYLLMSDMLLIICSGLTIGWFVKTISQRLRKHQQ